MIKAFDIGKMIIDWLIDNLIYVNLIFSIIIVFFQRRDPQAVWTWLLVLYFLPIVGFILYLVICQDFHKRNMFKMKEVEDVLNSAIRLQEHAFSQTDIESKRFKFVEYADLVRFNLSTSWAFYTDNNTCEIYTDGVEKFDRLIEEIDKAKSFIHIQYYIIRNDELFDRIKKHLFEKAKQGVEVRILYDSLGCRSMHKKDWKNLNKNGIKTGDFFPSSLGRIGMRLNYRNHRKIVVIDNKYGFVGGFNVGREYISKDKKFGYWRDTHLVLQGASVISLASRFALDWNYATKENLFLKRKYFVLPEDIPEGDNGIQIISSGPDSKYQQVRDNYLKLINSAKKNIYIQTPYFIPDESIMVALTMAIKSGIDVKLMIPCKPDHPFVYWATYSYMGELLSIGGKCYTYQNGFLHSKGIVVDGEVLCYGTANMDIRSFELNFEVNAVIYNENTAKKMEEIFLNDIKRCREVTTFDYTHRKLLIRIKEQVSRLMSPIM